LDECAIRGHRPTAGCSRLVRRRSERAARASAEPNAIVRRARFPRGGLGAGGIAVRGE
jgi:hypothetical protein